jgi:LPS-assembly lipoprotein
MRDAARRAPLRLSGWLLFGWLLAGLAGCGFQLRGSAALPAEMAVTYIQSAQPYSSLVGDFATALKARDLTVTEQRSRATAVLHIIDNDVEKRVLSVNTAGKVLEYELRQTVTFSVTTAANQPLLEEQKVSLSRDYLYSNTDILGKEREDEQVRNTLQRNVVNMAMLRLAAARK